MNPKPGEIRLADLGLAAKTRPVIIVSRYDPASPRALVLYVPLTLSPMSLGRGRGRLRRLVCVEMHL